MAACLSIGAFWLTGVAAYLVWRRVPGADFLALMGQQTAMVLLLAIVARALAAKPLRDQRPEAPRGEAGDTGPPPTKRQGSPTPYGGENTYRSIFDNSLDGLLLLTSDGEILAANAAAQRIFGMDEDELKRRGRAGVLDQTDPAVTRSIQERQRTGRSHAVLRMIRGNGERFSAEISAAQFRSADGRTLVSVVVRDITDKLQSERQLQASEAQLRSVFENSMDAIVLSDPDKGIVLACNRAAEALFGMSEAELKKQSRERMIDMDSPGLADFLRERDETGRARGVLRIRNANGTPIPVEATTSVFHDEEGNRRSSVVFRDISESMRREQALRESEDRFRALFEQSLDAIFISEPDGTIHDANPAAERLFGLSREEFRKIGRAALVDESELAFQQLMEERAEKERAQGEIHVRRADGTWLLADVNVVAFSDYHGRERVSVVVRDITEKRRQEELLRESEDRFRAVFEHSSDAIFVVDPEDGRTLSANVAAQKLLGLTEQELIGRTRNEDVLIDDPSLEEFLEERRRAGRARAVLRMRRGDGSAFPAEVTSAIFRDRKGRDRASVIVRDVTEREAYEAQLKQSEERFRTVADHTGQAVYEMELATRRMTWAGACRHMFGVETENLANMTPAERLSHIPANQRDSVARRYRAAARKGGPFQFEYELTTTDGRRIEIEDRGVVIRETGRMYGVIQDVTERHELIRRLERQKQELAELSTTQQAILDALPAHVALLDEKGTVSFVNSSWRRYAQRGGFGDPEGVLGENYLHICEDAAKQGDAFAGKVARAIRETIAGERSIFDEEYPAPEPEAERWFRQVITPYRSGRTRGAVVAHLDVTDRVLAERQLELVAAAFRSADEALVICDADFRIEDLNHAFETMIGVPRSGALGTRPGFLAIGNQESTVREGLDRNGEWRGELLQRRADGKVFTSRASVMEIRGTERGTRFLVLSFEDISRLREIERRVDYLSYHDALTGLPNRAALEQWFREFARANGNGHRMAMAYVDLDSFRAVNESHGHSMGDELLVEVGRRLQEAGGERDYVARLGGDDFLVMMPGVARRGEAVSRVNAIIRAIAEPLELKGGRFYLSATAGVSRFPDDGETLEELLRSADAAHAAAKQQGRGQIRLFTLDLQEDVRQHLLIESHLRDAIHRGELELHYQPSVRLSDGRILGLEALVRWHSPELGRVSPSRFVAVAEKTGLINELGAWVLDAACRQIRQWLDRDVTFGTLAVNLSPMQFQYVNLVSEIHETLQRHGLEGRHLRFEITENVLMLDPDYTIRLLKELRDLDIEIAVDDFGTGYSSMAYLRNFPVQYMKLDRTFVKELPDNDTDASIARTVISLAEQLDLTVIAEGVETRAQRDCLLAWGCDQAQGYYFSTPLASAVLERLLERHSSLPPAD